MKRIVFCGVGALGSNAVVSCRNLEAQLVLVEAARDIETEGEEAIGRPNVRGKETGRAYDDAKRDRALFVAEEGRVIRGVEHALEAGR